MKSKKTTPATKSKKATSEIRSRKMEPIKSKEMKNQDFDNELDEDEGEIDPEMMDDNFKGFEESFEGSDDDDDDY